MPPWTLSSVTSVSKLISRPLDWVCTGSTDLVPDRITSSIPDPWTTSLAFSANLSVAINTSAPEFSMIYRNSTTGNPGDRGTAIPSPARIDSRVTILTLASSLSSSDSIHLARDRLQLTNVVVVILHQKRGSASFQPSHCLTWTLAWTLAMPLTLYTRTNNITQQLPILERRRRRHDSRGRGVMRAQSSEQREIRDFRRELSSCPRM